MSGRHGDNSSQHSPNFIQFLAQTSLSPQATQGDSDGSLSNGTKKPQQQQPIIYPKPRPSLSAMPSPYTHSWSGAFSSDASWPHPGSYGGGSGNDIGGGHAHSQPRFRSRRLLAKQAYSQMSGDDHFAFQHAKQSGVFVTPLSPSTSESSSSESEPTSSGDFSSHESTSTESLSSSSDGDDDHHPHHHNKKKKRNRNQDSRRDSGTTRNRRPLNTNDGPSSPAPCTDHPAHPSADHEAVQHGSPQGQDNLSPANLPSGGDGDSDGQHTDSATNKAQLGDKRHSAEHKDDVHSEPTFDPGFIQSPTQLSLLTMLDNTSGGSASTSTVITVTDIRKANGSPHPSRNQRQGDLLTPAPAATPTKRDGGRDTTTTPSSILKVAARLRKVTPYVKRTRFSTVQNSVLRFSPNDTTLTIRHQLQQDQQQQRGEDDAPPITAPATDSSESTLPFSSSDTSYFRQTPRSVSGRQPLRGRTRTFHLQPYGSYARLSAVQPSSQDSESQSLSYIPGIGTKNRTTTAEISHTNTQHDGHDEDDDNIVFPTQLIQMNRESEPSASTSHPHQSTTTPKEQSASVPSKTTATTTTTVTPGGTAPLSAPRFSSTESFAMGGPMTALSNGMDGAPHISYLPMSTQHQLYYPQHPGRSSLSTAPTPIAPTRAQQRLETQPAGLSTIPTQPANPQRPTDALTFHSDVVQEGESATGPLSVGQDELKRNRLSTEYAQPLPTATSSGYSHHQHPTFSTNASLNPGGPLSLMDLLHLPTVLPTGGGEHLDTGDQARDQDAENSANPHTGMAIPGQSRPPHARFQVAMKGVASRGVQTAKRSKWKYLKPRGSNYIPIAERDDPNIRYRTEIPSPEPFSDDEGGQQQQSRQKYPKHVAKRTKYTHERGNTVDMVGLHADINHNRSHPTHNDVYDPFRHTADYAHAAETRARQSDQMVDLDQYYHDHDSGNGHPHTAFDGLGLDTLSFLPNQFYPGQHHHRHMKPRYSRLEDYDFLKDPMASHGDDPDDGDQHHHLSTDTSVATLQPLDALHPNPSLSLSSLGESDAHHTLSATTSQGSPMTEARPLLHAPPLSKVPYSPSLALSKMFENKDKYAIPIHSILPAGERSQDDKKRGSDPGLCAVQDSSLRPPVDAAVSVNIKKKKKAKHHNIPEQTPVVLASSTSNTTDASPPTTGRTAPSIPRFSIPLTNTIPVHLPHSSLSGYEPADHMPGRTAIGFGEAGSHSGRVPGADDAPQTVQTPPPHILTALSHAPSIPSQCSNPPQAEISPSQPTQPAPPAPAIAAVLNPVNEKFVSCNCSKNGCLKRYCVCFGNDGFCSPLCRCVNCKNKGLPEHALERDIARSKILKRDQTAFFSRAILIDSAPITEAAAKTVVASSAPGNGNTPQGQGVPDATLPATTGRAGLKQSKEDDELPSHDYTSSLGPSTTGHTAAVQANDPPGIVVALRGCSCRKNQCLKNYCYCRRNGAKCGPHCRCCSDCMNRLDTPGASGTCQAETNPHPPSINNGSDVVSDCSIPSTQPHQLSMSEDPNVITASTTTATSDPTQASTVRAIPLPADGENPADLSQLILDEIRLHRSYQQFLLDQLKAHQLEDSTPHIARLSKTSRKHQGSQQEGLPSTTRQVATVMSDGLLHTQSSGDSPKERADGRMEYDEDNSSDGGSDDTSNNNASTPRQPDLSQNPALPRSLLRLLSGKLPKNLSERYLLAHITQLLSTGALSEVVDRPLAETEHNRDIIDLEYHGAGSTRETQNTSHMPSAQSKHSGSHRGLLGVSHIPTASLVQSTHTSVPGGPQSKPHRVTQPYKQQQYNSTTTMPIWKHQSTTAKGTDLTGTAAAAAGPYPFTMTPAPQHTTAQQDQKNPLARRHDSAHHHHHKDTPILPTNAKHVTASTQSTPGVNKALKPLYALSSHTPSIQTPSLLYTTSTGRSHAHPFTYAPLQTINNNENAYSSLTKMASQTGSSQNSQGSQQPNGKTSNVMTPAAAAASEHTAAFDSIGLAHGSPVGLANNLHSKRESVHHSAYSLSFIGVDSRYGNGGTHDHQYGLSSRHPMAYGSPMGSISLPTHASQMGITTPLTTTTTQQSATCGHYGQTHTYTTPAPRSQSPAQVGGPHSSRPSRFSYALSHLRGAASFPSSAQTLTPALQGPAALAKSTTTATRSTTTVLIDGTATLSSPDDHRTVSAPPDGSVVNPSSSSDHEAFDQEEGERAH